MPARSDAHGSMAPPPEAPRFASAWAALVYVAAAMTLAYPALTGAFAAQPRSDQFIAGFGFREFAAQALRAGQGFPQWDAYLQGGMPYIAAMHGDIFYPTFLLRMLMPTDVAMTWGFIIHLILAGWLTYGFLRSLGLTFYASLIGGLAYMMSGPIAAYVSPGHDGKLFVSSLFPLSLWMLVRWVRDGRLWAVGALALTVGLAVLSPHPQLLQYLLLASGSFALYLAVSRLSRSEAFKRLSVALGAVIVGGAIGAIQYLPVRMYVAWSPRAAGGSSTGWEHAISYSMPPEELLNVFVPQFSGILDAYWGRNGIHLHSEYVGVVVLVLAGLGMFAVLPRSLRLFWVGTLIVSLLWTLGGNTPFYRLVYWIVPGAKYFRAPSTMMYVSMFSVAVLAAFGVERLLAGAASISRRFMVGWGAAAVLISLLAIGAAIPIADSLAARMAEMGVNSQRTAYLTELARSNQSSLVLGAVRSLAFTALTLAVLWLASAGRIVGRRLAIAIAVLLVVDLWSIERLYWGFSRPARESFATDPAIDAMKAAAEPGRVVVADFTGRIPGVERVQFRDPVYSGSAFMVHHVRSVTGYHGNELARYQELLQQGSKVFFADRQELWRHENVHWLYTNIPDSLMPPVATQLGYSGEFTKVVGPVKNASGSTVYLYRVPGENPAAVVANAIVKGTDDQALATVLDSRFDPRRAAIIDTAESLQTAQLTTIPEPSSVQARTTRYESGAINVELSAPVANSGNMLIVSENYYPGWSATVGGQAVQPLRANYNLIGVPLPVGARQIELRFQDPAYATGKVVTVIAILVAVAMVVFGVVVERRRPAAVAG